MTVNSVKIKNFRNIADLCFTADNGVNVIYGENAQGKTNILESIWLFTGCKSFRGAKDNELIKFGEDFSKIKLEFSDNLREKKSVDICLLNHGGIRSIIPQGNVTTRTAFELMPFENNLVVVALKGEQILEMADYIIKERKPHPLSGIQIILNKDGKSYKSISIQGKPLDLNKTYYGATNDYLYNGGDSMYFFKKGTAVYDLDYKLRNVWIDYFKEVDTIPVPQIQRIIVE